MEETQVGIQTVGFVGLGQMGWHMASNLARAGCALVVADSDGAVVERFAAAFGGARAAAGAGDLAGVPTLVTMLPSGEVVRDVLLGGGGRAGIAAVLPRGALVIDMSSSDPAIYPALAASLAGRGIGLIDAPVSGNVSGAEAATLTIMAGGGDALVDRAEPLFRIMGGTVFRTGPLGSGQAMKALNNLVSAAGLMVTVEALLIGQRFGLDPRQMNDILNVSTGRNNSTERKIAPFVLSGRYDSGFRLALMAKDLRAAGALAERAGMMAEISALCVRLADQAERELGPQADHTEVARFIERRTGEGFRH